VTEPDRATYVLAGWPLAFSLSPAMHGAAFRALGIAADYRLQPTKPADLPALMAALRSGELAGANLTVPHKTQALPLLEDASDLAIGIGAVNTVLRDTEGQLRGENTDGAGFRYALERAGALEGRDRLALVLGAGGAARAVGYVLLRAGYRLRVLARSSAQSAILAAQLHRAYPEGQISTGPLRSEEMARFADSAALLVNTTPVGGAAMPGASLWPEAAALPSAGVIDIVAWPLETPLVARARSEGLPAFGGLDMLLRQAARAFTLWTGQPAPEEAMRAAALEAARATSNEVGPDSDFPSHPRPEIPPSRPPADDPRSTSGA
jgi:shikimate dehydrogenase